MGKETGTRSRRSKTAGRTEQIKLLTATEVETSAALNEKELLSAARQGCTDSFGELVSRLGPGLLEFLRHRTATLEDAEDLVQETFVRAYLKLDQFSGQWRFSTWLYTIARRLAINHYRRRRFAPLPTEYESTEAMPEDILANREMSVNLWSIAKSLPVNQYEAVWLKYAEGMSVRQISRIMKRSQVSVKVLLYRGRINMGKRFERIAKERATRDIAASGMNYHIHESAGV